MPSWCTHWLQPLYRFVCTSQDYDNHCNGMLFPRYVEVHPGYHPGYQDCNIHPKLALQDYFATL